MQRLSSSILQPEMISAVDIAERSGRVLLRAGMPFQEKHIQLMHKLGFGSAYVELPLCIAEPPAKILNRDVQDSSLKIVRQVYETYRDKGEADGTPIRDLANRLVNEVIVNRGRLVQWVDLRTPEEYLPAHVLQVAVLSILIGLKLEYYPAKLQELCVGALMLDIGEMLIPPEILHKSEKLTQEEMEIIKKHSENGFEGLRKKITGIPATSAHVAYQHHENFAGNGYPRESVEQKFMNLPVSQVWRTCLTLWFRTVHSDIIICPMRRQESCRRLQANCWTRRWSRHYCIMWHSIPRVNWCVWTRANMGKCRRLMQRILHVPNCGYCPISGENACGNRNGLIWGGKRAAISIKCLKIMK